MLINEICDELWNNMLAWDYDIVIEIKYKCKVECVKLRDTRKHEIVDCDIMRCKIVNMSFSCE